MSRGRGTCPTKIEPGSTAWLLFVCRSISQSMSCPRKNSPGGLLAEADRYGCALTGLGNDVQGAAALTDPGCHVGQAVAAVGCVRVKALAVVPDFQYSSITGFYQ